jgi:hypothetical protein
MKKAGATRSGVPFLLEFEDIRWPTHCPALGFVLDYSRRRTKGSPRARSNSPSFDRVDPSIGYVRGNVVVISHRANQIKTNAMPAEMRDVANWLERVITMRKS